MVNGIPALSSAHICLGVCTYQRPQMLIRCLVAAQRLAEPIGTRLSIVVVDNEPYPAAAELVRAFSDQGRPMHYVNERRRGIAQARNAVLEKAAELGADWVAMLDDDQLVAQDWLLRMWHSARLTFADVVKSTVQFEMPEPRPAWALSEPKPKGWKLGLKITQTNGVLFRANLQGSDGSPLRFDTRFALTGGEDSDFFTRAIAYNNARMVLTPEAVAYEHLPATRLTFAAQVYRCYCSAHSGTQREVEHRGFARTAATKSVKSAGAIFKAIYALVLAPFVALSSKQSARRKVLWAGKSVATAAGIVTGLLRIGAPQPYRTIHGS